MVQEIVEEETQARSRSKTEHFHIWVILKKLKQDVKADWVQ